MTQTANPEHDAVELTPIKSGWLETFRLIRQSYKNPLLHARYMRAHYGDAVMQRVGGMNYVTLFGAEAHRLALVNENQLFSNKKAWDLIIGRIFPNGLMLRDGEDHRYHRRLMQAGFKSKVLQRYLREMQPQVSAAVSSWDSSNASPLLAFPTFKRMTLDLAATIFLGLDLGEEATRISKAFEASVAASMPRIPLAIPGTILWKGIRAREYMCQFFLSQIAQKRAGDGQDMFSLLCRAGDEDGNRYTDQEVVDHIIFLMMAAHDTTTSTLTSMAYTLARYPQWQQRLRQEAQSLGTEQLAHDQLDQLVEMDWVIKESLRMYPPLSTLPKFSNAEFEYAGYRIPADAMVATYPIHTHYMEEYWDHPERFDPERFSDSRAEHRRHAYCWVPFSGGAHMCIGLHFAVMQIKLVMFEMLRRYQWSVPEGYEMPVQQSPISRPRDDLPIVLKPNQASTN